MIRALIISILVFFMFSVPASAAPEGVFTNTSWWKQPMGCYGVPPVCTPNSLYVSHVAANTSPHGVAALVAEAYSNLQLAQGPADATAIIGITYMDNPNGYGVGGYFETHAQCPVINGQVEPCSRHGAGAEIRSSNYTTTQGIYQPNYASPLVGLWVTTAGLDSSAAIQTGTADGSRWKVGLGLTSGTIAESSIRDDSQSQIAIDIRGLHETAIKVAQGAGKVVLDAPIWINGKLVELVPCGVQGYKCLAVRE